MLQTVRSGELDIATTDWRGDGPALLLVHATGFCAALWNEIARPLTTSHRVIGYDQRGHGNSSKPRVQELYAWERYADDCLAVLDSFGLDRLDAVGHSSGATTLVLAAKHAPERFRRLVLIEPITFPPEFSDAGSSGEAADNPLAQGAKRRRLVFDSADEMRERLGSKPPFCTWDPKVLDDYVTFGSFDRADGCRELLCPGEIEAWMYMGSSGNDSYDILRTLSTKTLVLCGEDRSPLPVDYWRHIADRIPECQFEALEGLGHFAPMEAPDRVRHCIEAFLA